MLNPPGAKGRAFSSAGTPSRAIPPPEPRGRAGIVAGGPGHTKFPAPLSPSPPGADTAAGWLRPGPAARAALWSRLGYSSGAVGGRV